MDTICECATKTRRRKRNEWIKKNQPKKVVSCRHMNEAFLVELPIFPHNFEGMSLCWGKNSFIASGLNLSSPLDDLRRVVFMSKKCIIDQCAMIFTIDIIGGMLVKAISIQHRVNIDGRCKHRRRWIFPRNLELVCRRSTLLNKNTLTRDKVLANIRSPKCRQRINIQDHIHVLMRYHQKRWVWYSYSTSKLIIDRPTRTTCRRSSELESDTAEFSNSQESENPVHMSPLAKWVQTLSL